MSDLLLAPYLNVTAPVTVGPWSLVPFRALKQDDDEAAAESRTWLRETLRTPILRLVEAYRLKGGGTTLGTVVVPKDGRAGDPFDRTLMKSLGHALLAGSIADNPLMTLPEDEQAGDVQARRFDRALDWLSDRVEQRGDGDA